MTNSADPDQYCLLRQGMLCLAREGLNNVEMDVKHQSIIILHLNLFEVLEMSFLFSKILNNKKQGKKYHSYR